MPRWEAPRGPSWCCSKGSVVRKVVLFEMECPLNEMLALATVSARGEPVVVSGERCPASKGRFVLNGTQRDRFPWWPISLGVFISAFRVRSRFS